MPLMEDTDQCPKHFHMQCTIYIAHCTLRKLLSGTNKIHDYHGRLYFNHCITYCRTLCRIWPRIRCTLWPHQKGRPLCRPPMIPDMILLKLSHQLLPARIPLMVLSWLCSHPPCYAWVVWWLSFSWLSSVVWLSSFPSSPLQVHLHPQFLQIQNFQNIDSDSTLYIGMLCICSNSQTLKNNNNI